MSQYKVTVGAGVAVIVMVVVVGSREMTVTGLQVVGVRVTVLVPGGRLMYSILLKRKLKVRLMGRKELASVVSSNWNLMGCESDMTV